ncbi:Aspartyl protease family protein 1, partial [Bienertia sinuspersici]
MDATSITTVFLLFALLSPTFPSLLTVNSTSVILNHIPSSLLVPLSLSRTFPNVKLRRHLQPKHFPSNARLNFSDDLLSNGYYTAMLHIGTPPQKFALIVDTGSSLTYVPCFDCYHCGNHQDPKFQPNFSSTYSPLKCNLRCPCDAENIHYIYEGRYAEMSSSSGLLVEDIVSFGSHSGLKTQRAVFGCENAESGGLYSQVADGIMGLGRGAISYSFSLCYGGMVIAGGAMILGSISPPSDMVFSHSDPDRSPYYNIDLKELHVAGKKLPLNLNVFDGGLGTVQIVIINELPNLKQIRGPDPVMMIFASLALEELSKAFPSVNMVFGNGQKYLLSPENYLFQHMKVPGAYCLGFFQNDNDPTIFLGVYDREHLKVGFWKTNCSELWKVYHLSDTSSTLAPTPSGVEVLTPEISPASAPNGILNYAIS